MESFSSNAAHAENYSAGQRLNESLFGWRCSMEFPANVKTLILMPIEYYTIELGDYKEGGINSNGKTCP